MSAARRALSDYFPELQKEEHDGYIVEPPSKL